MFSVVFSAILESILRIAMSHPSLFSANDHEVWHEEWCSLTCWQKLIVGCGDRDGVVCTQASARDARDGASLSACDDLARLLFDTDAKRFWRVWRTY